MADNGMRQTLFTLLTILCFSTFFISCNQKSKEGMLVLTQMKGDVPAGDYTSGKMWRYLPTARLVTLQPDNPKGTLQVLTPDFYSACGPKIAYDGRFLLFAGQKNENDTWQIWEMDLSNKKTRQVTASSENCIDPDYLPGNKLVFSKLMDKGTLKSGHMLFTCNLDGSKISQITFDPSTYLASTILQDGRVLTIGKQLLPNEKKGAFKVMRPDGTKQELFFKGDPTTSIHSPAWEMGSGKIVFAASNGQNQNSIISIDYNRPLHSMTNLTEGLQGDFYGVSTLQDEKLLTSYRANKDNLFSLYEFDAEAKTLGKPIYQDETYQILEAVAIKSRHRPKKLPSEVNPEVETALLMCQDINITAMEDEGNDKTVEGATRFEILGIDASLGIWDTEKDGSFYLKMPADTPFRIQTIDGNNQIVNGPGSWLYLRPNERRGCVGCHQNNEMAPKNRQPLAVRKDPIQIGFAKNGNDIEKYVIE
ncbi:HzsA-related protein [Maribacter arenosus]|uniref:Hydrazine synthase alpha subunit middle domain-containing protein n=1 Tax=Maribacter arenosus TaxID=1854708 RepID=A0ABR7VC52_9FLAO|nr:hypothetical protein [Maribacter arenosus]MBD0851240.1 hypothetical protein [Maribacter arenosus]